MSNPSSIILLDSYSEIEKIQHKIKEQNVLIITFDYNSHKTLLKNNIVHEISDNFVSEDDLKIIQKNSYSLAKWYEDPLISNLINYKGINLGSLYFLELHYVLVPFLKKFIEINKIIKKYPTTTFVCSSKLYDIAKTITTSAVRIDNEKIILNNFLYDSITINIQLGKRFFPLRIPRSYYIKIKTFSEIVIHKLFRPKNKILSDNSILMVEFDTIKFKNFFMKSINTTLNIILFDRRRPAIWNLKSFSIIKKSNCSITTFFDVCDKIMLNLIKEGISLLKEKSNSLGCKNIFFQSFFKISEISFWESFKPIFMELYEKRSLDAIAEIEITNRVLKKYTPSSIVVWSENGFNEQIIINLSKQYEIPIILFQHAGVIWDTMQAYDYNKLCGIFPLESDKYVVWGDVSKKYAINCGVPPKKIAVLGNSAYDKLFEEKNNGKKLMNDYILLATSSPNNNMITDLTVKTNENYEFAIKNVCKIALKMNKKLIIKLHPFQDEMDISKFVKEIDPTIIIIKTGDIIPLIKNCEVLIVTDISSTILEAQIFEKPVISISIKDYSFGDPEVYTSNSCIRTNPNDFEKILNKTLNNLEFKNDAILKGNKFVEDSLSNPGTASNSLLSFLKNMEYIQSNNT